mmetsp:Transcript_5594/g.15166  ORF Transcript_5594/g.15166 Transcript_5594/m.15166 type:complete len:223 (+) Transcript_5594:1658-2326(+)
MHGCWATCFARLARREVTFTKSRAGADAHLRTHGIHHGVASWRQLQHFAWLEGQAAIPLCDEVVDDGANADAGEARIIGAELLVGDGRAVDLDVVQVGETGLVIPHRTSHGQASDDLHLIDRRQRRRSFFPALLEEWRDDMLLEDPILLVRQEFLIAEVLDGQGHVVTDGVQPHAAVGSPDISGEKEAGHDVAVVADVGVVGVVVTDVEWVSNHDLHTLARF